MSHFALGPLSLAKSWEPLLHSSIRALDFAPIPTIDCDNCWMAHVGTMRHDTKCCTLMPTFPNFMIGEILTDGWAEGSAQNIGQWAQDRCDPLASHIPPEVAPRYQLPNHMLLQKPKCPMLGSDARCTVYEHRPPYCLAFHCLYPQNPHIIGFWNSLCSLLELHGMILAQYLVKTLCDVDQFKRVWASHDFAEVWDGEAWKPHFKEALWEGVGEPEAFFKRCYQYVLDHKDTIREALIAYRVEQLIKLAGDDERRILELQEQLTSSTTPTPLQPSPDTHKAFMGNHCISYGDHQWSVWENECYILWYHQHGYGAISAA